MKIVGLEKKNSQSRNETPVIIKGQILKKFTFSSNYISLLKKKMFSKKFLIFNELLEDDWSRYCPGWTSGQNLVPI